MRIISRKALREFWKTHPDAEQSLSAWYGKVKRATWDTPSDVKAAYRSASFVANNRVVFNIAGNKYRLVVKFNYPKRIGFIRFIGTHAMYDTIDSETI